MRRIPAPDLPDDMDESMPLAFQNALSGFDAVSNLIREYRVTTAPAIQRNLILRAVEQIEQVAQEADHLSEPFRSLIGLMVGRWRPILSSEGGRLASVVLQGPVANPYVAGNPVQGTLFIGREEIMRRLKELWSGTGQWPSVILYGHRRMGKTSILHNLSTHFGATTRIVDFNLQRFGLIESSGDLLYNLAVEIYEVIPPQQRALLAAPDEDRFLSRNPFATFDAFLRALGAIRGDLRFVIAIDEFEKIEEFIDAVRLDPHILDTLRGWIQTYPWFVLALAGLHRLEEMTHDYWNPLFGSVTLVPVSFLEPSGATRLITQPSADFELNYTPEAVQQIIDLTHGQPYLMQLIGHALVTLFNRQTFEDGIERERRFTEADVQAVIDAPEFFRDGRAYFIGVWNQAEQSEPPGQTTVLRALAPYPDGLRLTDIAHTTELSVSEVGAALAMLTAHDVVHHLLHGQGAERIGHRLGADRARQHPLRREEPVIQFAAKEETAERTNHSQRKDSNRKSAHYATGFCH
ncbi:MAG: ATP-binding protein [Blastochloris sp.]|nr:ATP-binding protein [Blastochloris sp.]